MFMPGIDLRPLFPKCAVNMAVDLSPMLLWCPDLRRDEVAVCISYMYATRRLLQRLPQDPLFHSLPWPSMKLDTISLFSPTCSSPSLHFEPSLPSYFVASMPPTPSCRRRSLPLVIFFPWPSPTSRRSSDSSPCTSPRWRTATTLASPSK